MSLRDLAASDFHNITTDSDGFSWSATIVDLAGNSYSISGLTSDISQLIDPDTGQLVNGRLASLTVSLTSLAAAGVDVPRAVADTNSRPWLIVFDDVTGQPHTFKVRLSNPDLTVGSVSLILEHYDA